MKRSVFIIVLALMAFSCGNNSEKSSEEIRELEDGNYKVLEFEGENISAEDYRLQVDAEEKRLAGNLGCNNFSTRYEFTDEGIRFKPGIGTKMYCEGKMQYEDRLGEILPEISKLVKNGEDLIFLSETEEELLKITKID
ncbi:META domain-containing protein [Salegentibacter sp. HM20]